jgi:hypothetical protein
LTLLTLLLLAEPAPADVSPDGIKLRQAWLRGCEKQPGRARRYVSPANKKGDPLPDHLFVYCICTAD